MWLLAAALAAWAAGPALGQDEVGNIDFIDSFDPRPPGDTNADGDMFRVTDRISGMPGRHVDKDYSKIDRRREEGWWHLYPFGERFHDVDTAGRPWNDQQIDLDFFFPYYGFRFNYTFIFPEGFVAFSYPQYIQPPYTFPNPRWPEEYDPALVAAFMSPQTTMAVGEVRISHVWHRIVARPPNMIGLTGPGIGEEDLLRPDLGGAGADRFTNLGNPQTRRYYRGQLLRTQDGRIEDPDFLDQITLDIRKGMVGARGFTADYALIVTWERMAYGGAPKYVQLNLYDQVKRWQNTYQMVIASDEIRSYVMFNYANINWTSSTSAGALFGRGGRQSAIVGFNGGNGTGFYQLPYSAEGNSYKLVQFGSTQTAGRWLARTDENIVYGGCINTSIGVLRYHTPYGPMLGGFALNVSGPCFRAGNIVKMQLDILTIDCRVIDMVVARCVIPVNALFKTGLMDIKLSIDGGRNYPWINKFYIMQPALSRNFVQLRDDPLKPVNNWRDPNAENLTLAWPAFNISTDPNAQVDITLWGYWEDVEGHSLVEIGSIAKAHTNNGVYAFNPRTLATNDMLHEAWKKYQGGLVQVRVSDDWMADMGDGLYWSRLIPFGWYFRKSWEYEYGSNWANDLCDKWYEYDGRRDNFIMELEVKHSCPCTLNQAVADFGRFAPLSDCDAWGNSECYYTQGAQHCVVSTVAAWNGAGQMCCYDYEGWLMHSDDYEFTPEYLRFYSAGVPYRAHPWGSFPFQRPPYVPSMSNFYNDLMPYEMCCKWAGVCEFYFWRRQSSGCQEYRSPVTGYVYGQGHFYTFDGLRYPFQGKGYFVLASMKGPHHDLMVQVRMEQPPKTIWDDSVPATVVTGVAASDNGSATIQVFARKEFRRERYHLDVYVDGVQIFFDLPWKKLQDFQGGTLRNPPRNMNTSEIEIMFETGVGVKVAESRGQLSVMVSLPFGYNETLRHQRQRRPDGTLEPEPFLTGIGKCSSHVRTLGLLGTFNGDRTDELITPECGMVNVGLQQERLNENEARNVYFDFGEKWRVDSVKYNLLFQTRHKALYHPNDFASPDFTPAFEPFRNRDTSYWQSLIFTPDQVRSQCQGVPSCEYDYMTSGRKEVALETLSYEKKYQGVKLRGEERLISCGALVKNRGVLKYPTGNNYLDGVTVTFTCKPEYFLHGTQQRTCQNGTWSPGWWVWCRSRAEETGLKWMTGIVVSLLILALIIGIFVYCWCLRVKGYNDGSVASRRRYQTNPGLKASHYPSPGTSSKPSRLPTPDAIPMKQPVAMVGQAAYQTERFTAVTAALPVMEVEPGSRRVGLHPSQGSGSNVSGGGPVRYNETAA